MIRQFDTGANRDTDEGKHDPEGFISPLVILEFNAYMHENRRLSDGSLRDSANWQKGIPRDVYMKSLWRHFLDVWLHHRSYGHLARDPLRKALCGLLFNVQGYLLEQIKHDMDMEQVDKGLGYIK